MASIEITFNERENDNVIQRTILQYPEMLNSQAGEIRLLVVDPGEFDDPISARFEIVRIQCDLGDTPREFWALSYCWSDPSETTELAVSFDGLADKRTFSVSRVVTSAIQKLRSPDRPLVIWIDAICINQQDTIERSEQVVIMDRIYHSAAEVHIWLGEEGRTVKSALRIIRDVCNVTRVSSISCDGGERCVCPKGWTNAIDREPYLAAVDWDPEDIPIRHMNTIFQKHREMFLSSGGGFFPPDVEGNSYGLAVLMSELFGHAWFWRVWVMQEATLAKHAILYCGEEVAEWKELMTFHRWLDSPEYKFSFWERHWQPQVRTPSIWAILERMVGETSAGLQSSAQSPILDVFLNALDLSATDPRDKLYALLPFGSETPSGSGKLPDVLRPNYQKPVAQVYADVTKWWIKKQNSLAILSMIHSQPTRTWNCMLGEKDQRIHAPIPRPTWTVSYGSRTQFIYSSLNSKFAFKAGSNTVPDIQLLDESSPLALQVTGYRVGTIIKKGYPPLITGPNDGCVITDPTCRDEDLWLAETGVGVDLIVPGDAWLKKRSVATQQWTVDKVFETMMDPCHRDDFQRSLSSRREGRQDNEDANSWLHKYADHLKSHGAYFPEVMKSLPVLIKEVGPVDVPERLTARLRDTQYIPPCLSEGLFISSEGFFGACPWTAKESDLIVLLQGATVLYLLRKVLITNPDARLAEHKSQREEFLLIREFFVEGI